MYQTCVDFYYPVTNSNSYSVTNAITYLEDSLKNTNGVNAIIDVKNLQCHVISFTTACSYSGAASGTDWISTCTCSRVTG